MDHQVVEIIEDSNRHDSSISLTYRFDTEASMKLVRTRIELDKTFNACRNSRQVSQAWEALIKKCGWEGIVTHNKVRRRWDNISTLFNRYLNAKDGSLEKAKLRSPYLSLLEDYRNMKLRNITDMNGVQSEVLIPNQPEETLNYDHDYLMISSNEGATDPIDQATSSKSPNRRKDLKRKTRSLPPGSAGSSDSPITVSRTEELMEKILSALERSNEIHTKIQSCLERYVKHIVSDEGSSPPSKTMENIVTTKRPFVQPVYIQAKPLKTYSKLPNQ